jgi:hypothetical protein
VNFFENDIVYQIPNINLNKIIGFFNKKLKEFFKEFLKNILRIFQEYFSPSSLKSSQKASGCSSCYHICTPFFLDS